MLKWVPTWMKIFLKTRAGCDGGNTADSVANLKDWFWA